MQIGTPSVADLAPKPFVPKGEPDLLPFDQVIHEAAGRHHMDADLILAVILAESRLNPTAKSKKGAKGLMQLMPVTADALDVADIYSPEENVNAGVRHLRWLLDRFDGDLRMALAAYNAGHQNVLRHDGIPPFPETRASCAQSSWITTPGIKKRFTLDFSSLLPVSWLCCGPESGRRPVWHGFGG